MKTNRRVAAVLAAAVLAAGLCGCQKGSGERAGRAVDKAVANAGEQIEKAGDRIHDTAKDKK